MREISKRGSNYKQQTSNYKLLQRAQCMFRFMTGQQVFDCGIVFFFPRTNRTPVHSIYLYTANGYFAQLFAGVVTHDPFKQLYLNRVNAYHHATLRLAKPIAVFTYFNIAGHYINTQVAVKARFEQGNEQTAFAHIVCRFNSTGLDQLGYFILKRKLFFQIKMWRRTKLN